MKRGLVVGWVCLFSAACVFAAEDPAPVEKPAEVSESSAQPVEPAEGSGPAEKEYYEGTVLMVDPQTGYIGVSFKPQIEGEPETKKAFRTGPDLTDVYDAQNQYRDFSDIRLGDFVDVTVEVSSDGTESAIFIQDFSMLPEE